MTALYREFPLRSESGWTAIVAFLRGNAWLNGRQYSKDVWHEYLTQSYLPKEEMVLPDGEIIQRRKSTTELTVAEFAEYTEKCRAYAAVDLGIEILD